MHVDECQSQDDCEISRRQQDVQPGNDMFVQEIDTGETNVEVSVEERMRLMRDDQSNDSDIRDELWQKSITRDHERGCRCYRIHRRGAVLTRARVKVH